MSFGRLSVSQSASDLAENGKRIEPVSRDCAVCQFVGGKKPLVTRLRLTTQLAVSLMHVMASNKSTRPNSRRQLSAANLCSPLRARWRPASTKPGRSAARAPAPATNPAAHRRSGDGSAGLPRAAPRRQPAASNPTTASGPPPRSRCSGRIRPGPPRHSAWQGESRDRYRSGSWLVRRSAAVPRSLPEVTGTRSRTIVSSAGTYGCAATRPEETNSKQKEHHQRDERRRNLVPQQV